MGKRRFTLTAALGFVYCFALLLPASAQLRHHTGGPNFVPWTSDCKQTLVSYYYTSFSWYYGPYGYTTFHVYAAGTEAHIYFADGYNPTNGQDVAYMFPVRHPLDRYPTLDQFTGDFNSSHWCFKEDIDFSTDEYATFGPADHIHLAQVDMDGDGAAGQSTNLGHPKATGGAMLCSAQVSSDGTNWKPATGAVFDLVGPGGLQYRTFCVGRDKTATKSTVALFQNEHGDNTTTQTFPHDAQFCDGLKTNVYKVYCTYQGRTLQSNEFQGRNAPNSAIMFRFGPSNNNTTQTITDGSPLPDGSTIGDSAPGQGDDPPATGGSIFDPTAFLASLKALFLELFTPTQADVDALAHERDLLFAWGPLALPGQLKTMYDSTIGVAMAGDSSDPNYWVLNLRTVPNLGSSSLPPGDHTPGNANEVSPTYLGFFPDHLDLTPFRFYLETGRAICLGVGWVFFVLTFIGRVAPQWRV